MTAISRRGFLTAAGTTGAGVVGSTFFPGLARAASVQSTSGATLDDIEHIVVFMQENRSFDEYFGRMSGVIGFDDPNALTNVFKQVGGDRASGEVNTDGYTLPWRLDTTKTDGQTTGGLSHAWDVQHFMYAEGLMTNFCAGQLEESVVMGYFDREDIPYHYALADAFTVLDRYHCSVLGPTNPNRIMLMSGTVDPDGAMGGPVCGNYSTNGQLNWVTVPELLQAKGVDWYLYQEGGANSDNYGDNMLPFFTGFQDTTTDLYRRGNTSIEIAKGQLPGTGITAKLKDDVLSGRLPQVSFIVGPAETTEHPDYSPGRGAQFIDQVLEALTADMDVWAKTLVILNYDENDGHFDHVVPPTPPPGTAHEWVYDPVPNPGDPSDYLDITPPQAVGLGFRVPCILISPFTVGPLVSSDVFDHTSVIQLLELKYGITCPNISDWRRSTAGNLVNAINFAATPVPKLPALPDGDEQAAKAAAQSALPSPYPPSPQVMPTQEKTPLRGTPSGPVTGSDLPEIPTPALLPAAAVAVGLGIYALRTRRERSEQSS